MPSMQLLATSAAVVKGDHVCLVADPNGLSVVTKATSAALLAAGRTWGICQSASVAPGARGTFANEGDHLVPASVTLLTSGGLCRVSTTTARTEVVSTYTEGDYPCGTADSGGRLLFAPGRAVTGTGLATVSVATVAALAALDATAFPTGTVALVESVKDGFRLDKTSALTPTAMLTVAAVGGGNWVREGLPFLGFSLVLDWYWDPANSSGLASDDGDGLSLTTPLLTHAELMRRVRAGGVTAGYSVHVMSASAAENLVINPQLTAVGFIYYFSSPTALFSGTLTAVTNCSEATGQDPLITDTSLPVSWTASGLVGKVVRITGGARAGTQFVVQKDMGTKQARISQPQNGIFSNSVVNTLQVGDPYTVYSFPKLGSLVSIDIHGGNGAQAAFSDLDVGAIGSHSVEVKGIAFFDSCILNGFDGTDAGAEIQFYNCAFVGGCRAVSGAKLLLRQGTSGGCEARTGSAITLINHSCQGGNIAASSDGYIEVSSTGYASVFDVTVGALASPFGRLNIVGRLWGKSVAGPRLSVKSGAAVVYDSTKPIAMTGTGVETTIGGVNKTYAELASGPGYVNPTNFASVVQLA